MRRSSARPLIRRRELLLQFDRTGNRIDRAAEFDQHPIAHHLDNAAMMQRHRRIENSLPPLPQRRQRPRLIPFDEPAVTGDIGGEDRGKAAVHGGSPD